MPWPKWQNLPSLPRSKVKSVLVAPNIFHLALGIPCSHFSQLLQILCLPAFSASILSLPVPLSWGPSPTKNPFPSCAKAKSFLPSYLSWPTNCLNSWVPNRPIPKTSALLAFKFLLKHETVPPCKEVDLSLRRCVISSHMNTACNRHFFVL